MRGPAPARWCGPRRGTSAASGRDRADDAVARLTRRRRHPQLADVARDESGRGPRRLRLTAPETELVLVPCPGPAFVHRGTRLAHHGRVALSQHALGGRLVRRWVEEPRLAATLRLLVPVRLRRGAPLARRGRGTSHAP